MNENGSGVVDTGAGGGLLFDFHWDSSDPLSGNIAPRRYGRVDIDLGGAELASGIISEIFEMDRGFRLRISVGPAQAKAVSRAIAADQVAIRVLS